jgi:TM2 domain-containing membrane protein YozV
MPHELSDKSRGVAFAFAISFGWFGAHRFYVGKTGTGVLQAVTLGGLGLWYLYDCILVGTGQFTDAQGRYVKRWDPEVRDLGEGSTDPRLLAEVESLRTEVAELAERLDFAERLLARPREGEGR